MLNLGLELAQKMKSMYKPRVQSSAPLSSKAQSNIATPSPSNLAMQPVGQHLLRVDQGSWNTDGKIPNMTKFMLQILLLA